MKRRDWIKTVGLGSLAVVPTVPTRLLGDVSSAFDTELFELVGSRDIKPDRRVELLVQIDAPNGAVIPVSVVSSVPDTQRIIVLVSDHAKAEVAQINTSHTLIAPRLSTHLQLQQPATVTALVETGMGWYRSSARIESLGESC